MAHQDQRNFCKRVHDKFPVLFSGTRALDCGSLDVNGNNRFLFEGGTYVGIDAVPGKNVDIVGKTHEHAEPDGSYGVVVSTEMLEHDPCWAESLRNMARLVKPGGVLLVTCATTGRAPHFFGPEEWNSYYRNLTEVEFREALDIEGMFDEFGFETNREHADLYFWGLRRDPNRSKKRAKKSKLKIAHVCNYAPGLSGMYGSVRELYFAEKRLGLNAGIVDDSNGKKIYGEYGVDGVVPEPYGFVDESDIICWHHASSDDWFNEPHRNVVMFLHGTPEFNLATEIHNKDNVMSLTIAAAAQKTCRAFVTMWRRHLPIWESLLRTRVDLVPCWVDLSAFRVSEHRVDENVIHIAMVDYWRLTREPFGLIMAVDWLRRHTSKKLIVDVWGLPNMPNQTWKAIIQWLVEEDIMVLKGVSSNPMKEIYHEVDMVITMSTEETRVVREAYACGVPVVLGRYVPEVSEYSADGVNPKAIAEQILSCHADLVSNVGEVRRNLRLRAEREFSVEDAAKRVAKIFERVVEDHGSVNRLKYKVRGGRLVKSVLETANLIRSEMLGHKPVVYTRFNDAKILLMNGHEGWDVDCACPQHNSPELREELRECFTGKWPGLMVGCAAGQENEGRMRHGVFARFEADEMLLDIVKKESPNRTFHNFTALAYQATFDTNWFVDFLNRCIRSRRVAMVCNEQVAQSKLVQRVFNVRHFIIIPPVEAYKEINFIESEVLKAAEEYDVILSAAGPVSNVLALRLCKNEFTAKGKAFLDIGSVADALAGIQSRSWIKMVGEQLKSGYSTVYAGEAAVDIVILTHGQVERTCRCFRSIQMHTKNRYRVIWIDNASKPEDVHAMRAVADAFETCEFIQNGDNLGFSKAVNQGLMRSLTSGEASHILLLNNDVVVTPGWLEHLLGSMESGGFMAIGPLTSENNPHSLEALRSIVPSLPKFDGESPDVRASRLWEGNGYKSIQSSNMLSFFCCLLRRSVVREIGQLDENLFCYGEDNDYCKRLARKGHKMGIALGAYVHHDHHATSETMGDGWVKSQQAKAMKYLSEKWTGVGPDQEVGPVWKV